MRQVSVDDGSSSRGNLQTQLTEGVKSLLRSAQRGEGEGAADAKEVLSLYKEQHGVEQNFSFLKDPAVVNAIFLKTAERIEALGVALLISLLIWRLIERKLRKHVEQTERPITGGTANPQPVLQLS
jgi:transposase